VERSSSGMYPTTPKRSCLDTAQLDRKKMIDLQELIRDSDFFNLSNSVFNPNAADFNTCKITIETENRRHSIIRTNFSMDKNLSLLVKAVTKYGS
jgi:hypothetical protein